MLTAVNYLFLGKKRPRLNNPDELKKVLAKEQKELEILEHEEDMLNQSTISECDQLMQQILLVQAKKASLQEKLRSDGMPGVSVVSGGTTSLSLPVPPSGATASSLFLFFCFLSSFLCREFIASDFLVRS